MRFTWDPTKARTNLQKHGVSFGEATTVLADPLARVGPDDIHLERCIIVGMSARAHILYCAFVEVEEDEVVRIISARLATSHERRDYEEGPQAG